jgi:hypothetical protein
MIHRKGKHLKVARDIEAPADIVWDLITDTKKWMLWGPSISSVICPDAIIRLGSKGTIRTPLGLRLDFEVTEYIQGRCWYWHVSGIRATGHRVEALGPESCRLAFTVPVWAAPYWVVCWIALQRIQRLALREAERTRR